LASRCRTSRPTQTIPFIKGAAILVVMLLSALGVKLVSDGVDLAGESPNGGLARIALAFVAFAVAIPVFLFVVLRWAYP
jgi:hypothetical protein